MHKKDPEQGELFIPICSGSTAQTGAITYQARYISPARRLETRTYHWIVGVARNQTTVCTATTTHYTPPPFTGSEYISPASPVSRYQGALCRMLLMLRLRECIAPARPSSREARLAVHSSHSISWKCFGTNVNDMTDADFCAFTNNKLGEEIV
jgi:hypothetical protein